MSQTPQVKTRSDTTGGITNSDEKLLKEKGYYFIRQLGEGSYAKVYLANQVRAEKNDLALACKVINTKKAPKEFVVKFLPRELDILGKVLHPNIVHIQAIYSRSNKFLIFMRYAEVGDLLDYVLEKGELGENISKVWAFQLSLAIQYLHTLQVAHRDIKCENILITKNFNVKLADFGFARFVVDYHGKTVKSSTFCGSLAYASPEILKGKPYYPKCSDIWSFGIVIYIMLNKSMPFNDGNIKVLYKQQVQRLWKFRNRILPTLTSGAVELVNRLLEPDFRKRPTIGQVVKDGWFEGQGLEMTEEEREALENASKAYYPTSKLVLDDKEKELVLVSKDREGFQSLIKHDNEIKHVERERRSSSAGGVTRQQEDQALPTMGEGSYAKVYLANQIRTDKNDLTLACKVINTKRAPKEFVAKFLPRELDILGKVLHPNIVHIHAIYSRSSKFLIFMRYAEVGDLLDYVLEKGELGENISKVWAYQLALAIQYLHTMQVAHRDIKCENILITNNFNVKLADFGFARFVVDYNGKPATSNTYCGSLAYASPEVLKGKPYYPKCCDIWSLGIVIYIMLNKSMPFNDGNIKILYKQQVQRQWKFRNKILPTLTAGAVEIVNKLLEPDYRKRVTIGQIVKDNWFDDHGLEMTEEERDALEAAATMQHPTGKFVFEEKERDFNMEKDRNTHQSVIKQQIAREKPTREDSASSPPRMVVRQQEDENLQEKQDIQDDSYIAEKA